MATDPLAELDRTEAERMVDDERGSLFNWLEFPAFLELQRDTVQQYPDRSFITEVCEMLKSDGQASGIETALSMPLRQANLTLDKADGPGGKRITEEVEDLLFRPDTEGGLQTPIETVVGQMTFAGAVRRTYHELVWTRRDNGRLGLRKIAWRPPGSCELVRDRKSGEMRGFKQYIDWDARWKDRPGVDWRGYVDIPVQRAAVHVWGQHRDPLYGWGDLEVTYWAWNLKRQVFQLWMSFLDNNALGKVLAYGKDPAEARKNAKEISRLKSSGVAAVVRPEAEAKMFDTLDIGSAGSAAYTEMMRYLDGMMSQSAMAGFMDLAGANNNPTRASTALSADQSGLFLASRHGAARELMATVNMQIIRPFVLVNFGPGKPVPRLKMEKIGSDQVDKAMAMLQQLGSSPNLQVPQSFLMLLVERVAAYLDLPDAKVREMIAEQAAQARNAAALAGMAQPDPNTPEGQAQDLIQGALGAVRGQPAAKSAQEEVPTE